MIAVLAVIAGAVGGALAAAGGTEFAKLSDHIARIRIEGVIVDSEAQRELLEELAENRRVKAIVVHIDSPGGTTAGAEALYDAIRQVAAEKPVVAVMGTVAASGGYLTAIAADHIVALGNTTTGSIGVILQWAEVSELLKTLGVDVREVKSGPLKGQPSPFMPLTDEAQEVTQAMVDESYEWFVGLVAQRRSLDAAEARRLADGRVFTGRQAVRVRLIDEIGNEERAVAWLEAQRDIPSTLEIVDWEAKKSGDISLSGLTIRLLLTVFGAVSGDFFDTLEKTVHPERLSLDGLVSVWHPR